MNVPVRRRDRARLASGKVAYETITGTLFGEQPRASDPRQGFIGDCYLLSALAALARADPGRLCRLLRPQSDGRYLARFHRRTAGDAFREETVLIDSTFPVRASDRQPIYARSAPRKDGVIELWPMLAEKAYAAWRGGYDVIGEGGAVEETLAELTGEPTRLFSTAEIHPEALWRLLTRATREGWPATVCTQSRAVRPGIDELGIHPNHILVFLGVHTWKGRRIVWLRDPFENPAIGRLALPDPLGVFTLAYDTFVSYFAEIHVNSAAAAALRVAPWPSTTIGEIFARSYILHDIPPRARRAIAADFRRRTFATGEAVVVQGDEASGYFMIQHGRAVVERREAGSRRAKRVALLQCGDRFGEESLLNDRRHEGTVRALTPVTVYRVSPRAFHRWVARYPEFAARFRRRLLVLRRLRACTRRELTSVSVDEMLGSGRLVRFAAGRTIFAQGDSPNGFFFLLVGRVILSRREGGSRRTIEVHPGEVFGELPPSSRQPRIATARAKDVVEALHLDVDAMATLARNFDVLQRQLEFFARRRARRLRV